MLTETAPRTDRFHGRPVGVVAVAGVLLHLVVGAGYGFHRDELYFLAESRRMAWGFVSEPPLTPAVGWVSRQLFGDALVGLRLWPALAGAVVAVVAALVARELGGGRVAQVVAALCTSTASVALGLFHLYSPTPFDQAFWAGCLYALVRLLNGGDRRWWLAFGAIAGVGLLNKNTLVFLAVALVVAVALTPQRWAWLRSPYPYAAGLLAVAIASPYLVWQTVHGWPMLHVAATISAGADPAWSFVPMQVLSMNPVYALVWVPGLVWLFRSPRFRPLAWVFVTMLVGLMLVGGRSYYLTPAYLPLFAAGGVVAERRLGRPALTTLVVAAVVALPTALPVLPVTWQQYLPFTSINPVLADSIGWQPFVAQLGQLQQQHPGAVVLAGNYGEAGAVEELGKEQAYSGHNAYGTWGPPPAGTQSVLAVGFRDPALLRRSFAQVSRVGTVDNGVGVHNEEQGGAIYLCTGPLAPWPQLWPSFVYVNN